MKNYVILIDQDSKVVLDLIPFDTFEKGGWVSGLRARYQKIAPSRTRKFGWCDCRSAQSTKASREWLKKNGYT